MFKLPRFFHSLKYAIHGLQYVWRNEQNFRIQVLIGLLVSIAMIWFRVPTLQTVILCMLIMFVLVLEIANTVFEKMVDILKPRMHSYVEIIKDMMAAIVLVAAVGSGVIAMMIFLPYLINWFYR
jgi:diacylglycerol kinase